MATEDSIRFILTHIPSLTFCAALLIASIHDRTTPAASRYLSWILLLAVGVDGLWAGLFHVFAPETAARFIGWQVSPFQYEIGVADIALGAVAVASFWRPLDFKAAVVGYAAIFYAGVAVGHVRQMIEADDFAPATPGCCSH